MKYTLTLLMASICLFSFGQEKKKKLKLEKGIYAVIQTAKGDITLQLEHEKTPMTVANFVGLAEGKFTFQDSIEIEEPFYDGLKFHRVINDFMIQGGDPLGTGSGNPGYKFYDETRDGLKHDGPGILSMANSGPATNGSQFFITHKATPWLDGKHTIFGHVISGQDVVNTIEQNDTIEHIKIIRKGFKNWKWMWKASKVFEETYNPIHLDKMQKKAEMEKIASMSKEEYADHMYEEIKKDFPQAKQSESGLVYIVKKEGKATKPDKNDKITLHYKGILRKSGKKFDSSYDREQPMTFQYKKQRMIPGFEEGIQLLGEKGKAKLIIPYYQAYGAKGRPGAIPPYSDLVFDIELLKLVPTTEDPKNNEHNHDGHNHNHEH